jgi:hypothetical protein
MSQDREQVALARRLRGEGRLLRHIAEELGVCVGTASAWTRGVLPYGTPPQSMQKREGLPLLKRLYREDQSIPEIAASTGIPATTLLQARPLHLSQLRHDRWKVERPPHLAVPTLPRMEVRGVESFNAVQGLS